jgi:hypothetical protein
VALLVLGGAASVLVVGGVVATVALWSVAPTGARLALVALDAALALFYGVIIVLTYQGLAKPHRPKPDERENRRASPRPDPPPRAPDAQLKLARRIASEMHTTLVRRQDGTYYLKIGPLEGRVPVHSGVVRFKEQGPDWVEASAYSWLCMLADALGAELVYDGATMEWHLRWEELREIRRNEDEL